MEGTVPGNEIAEVLHFESNILLNCSQIVAEG